MNPRDRAFNYWHRVRERAPYLCGECDVCISVGDALERLVEYFANLEDDEVPSIDGALSWLHNAYPRCPAGAVFIGVVREMFVAAVFATEVTSPLYSPPCKDHVAAIEWEYVLVVQRHCRDTISCAAQLTDGSYRSVVHVLERSRGASRVTNYSSYRHTHRRLVPAARR